MLTHQRIGSLGGFFMSDDLVYKTRNYRRCLGIILWVGCSLVKSSGLGIRHILHWIGLETKKKKHLKARSELIVVKFAGRIRKSIGGLGENHLQSC